MLIYYNMEIEFILLLLIIVILFFLFQISQVIKNGFASIKSRQDYIENKIDELK